ncbi:MAG: helix-turn-helix domain-containing protein, partial [Flavobacteriaceae bacterium]
MSSKQSNRAYYTERLNVITEFIQDHLDSKLSLNQLAEQSHFSPFHFHKITRSLLGEPIGSYISRIRLEHVAQMILYSNDPIEQIAYSVGYESPSSLSKQFKNHFGVSPAGYRKGKRQKIKKRQKMETKLEIKKAKIVQLEKKTAIYVKLKGNYQQLDYAGAWEKLWSEVKNQKLFTAGIEH